MPLSKRDKKVSLTKTSKKGMAMKQHLIEEIRKFLDKYDNIYVFTIDNMRNGPLKDLREEWRDSRFFFAKRKVMAIALGRSEADEVHKNIHKLAKQLAGQCGLLFTNRAKTQVLEWFKNYSQMEFAKSGFVATETVTLPAGPLPDFSFAIEPHLRSLGLPTQLEKGKIMLREEFIVCNEGVKLSPQQASILKLLGKQMAEFKVKIICMWSKDGSFEIFKDSGEAQNSVIDMNSNKEKKKKKKKKILSEDTQKSDVVMSEEVSLEEETHKNKKKNIPIQDSQKSDEKMSELVVEETHNSDKNTSATDNNQSSEEMLKMFDQQTINETEKPVLEEKIVEDAAVAEDTTKSASKTPRKSAKTKSEESIVKKSEELQSSEKSPQITRENPRRSMRTPKPIKRSPDQKQQSVKKLTETNKQARTPLKGKTAKEAKGTPRKSVSRRISELNSIEDVEMGE